MYIYIIYRIYTVVNTKQCNKHYILESDLDEIVLNLLNQHIKLVCDIDNKIDDIVSFSKIEYNSELKKIRVDEINKELEKYQKLLNELKKDYKCDFISEEDFDNFKEKYLYEINKLNLEKENLSKSKINSYNLDWINKFKNIGKLEEIDRNIVDSFIENIYVNDDKTVEILFRYKEQYKFALEYLKSQSNML